MNLGAEPKKVVILAVLVVVALGGLYMNSSGDSSTASTPRPVNTGVSTTPSNTSPVVAAKARTVIRAAGSEFRPRVLGTRPGDKTDPASIDPELKLDLLAKVQAVQPIDAGRNLFQFGAAPPPDKPLPSVPTGIPHIAVNQPPTQPQNLTPSGPPPPPPPPPINLKYYGYSIMKSTGQKEALLQDGDEILHAQENQIVKQRYRIVRIALTSIDIEDTQAKDTQTIKLQDIPG